MLRSRLNGVRTLSEGEVDLLRAHYEQLERWNKVVNLSSIRDLETAVVRHYCESIFLATHLPPGPLSVVDIGSGAGFPGVPVALVRPECTVTLVESHQRKAVFLKETTRNLSNVVVRAERAEQLEMQFDWLISRAVAWEDLSHFASRLAGRFALLVAAADADGIARTGSLSWQDPVALPWGRQQMLLLGSVSRGT